MRASRAKRGGGAAGRGRGKRLRALANATFEKRTTNSVISRNKEINTQKYAVGTKLGGGGQGPALEG